MKRGFGFTFGQKGVPWKGHKVGSILQIGKWQISRSSFSLKDGRGAGKVWWSRKGKSKDLLG